MTGAAPSRVHAADRHTGRVTDYQLADRLPTVSEHRALAEAVDWLDHFDYNSIGHSLDASQRGVVALSGDDVVGMGRLVGDGSHYFYVQDVIVHPDHTDAGLATLLVERLLEWVGRVAPATAFVGLFASPEAVGVYEDLRFERADDRAQMTGMYRFVEPTP